MTRDVRIVSKRRISAPFPISRISFLFFYWEPKLPVLPLNQIGLCMPPSVCFFSPVLEPSVTARSHPGLAPKLRAAYRSTVALGVGQTNTMIPFEVPARYVEIPVPQPWNFVVPFDEIEEVTARNRKGTAAAADDSSGDDNKNRTKQQLIWHLTCDILFKDREAATKSPTQTQKSWYDVYIELFFLYFHYCNLIFFMFQIFCFDVVTMEHPMRRLL